MGYEILYKVAFYVIIYSEKVDLGLNTCMSRDMT